MVTRDFLVALYNADELRASRLSLLYSRTRLTIRVATPSNDHHNLSGDLSENTIRGLSIEIIFEQHIRKMINAYLHRLHPQAKVLDFR